jgi:D-serine deaminase-like pyridoxal phosphate-dependent protein
MNSSKPIHWLESVESDQLLTPQVLINYKILLDNIKSMASFSKQHQLQLRPHLKTHKTAEIVQLQLEHGAIGLTVAKISEAEKLVEAKELEKQNLSILIAFPPVGEVNLKRIDQLQKQATIILMIDSLEQAKALEAYAHTYNSCFTVVVKINTGLHRCGLDPEQEIVLPFIKKLLQLTSVHFSGIMTHAGHAYGASSKEQLEEIGRYEGEIMVKLGRYLEQDLCQSPPSISVGSTPTVRISGKVKGVTEIRPGNYVFYDKSQVRLGSATWDNCALRVISRVVSHPAPGRWIIDAGSKTLALDQGAHGKSGVSGYGEVVGHPELEITRLSEEHGVIEGATDQALSIGDIVEIIPNHACPVVNLADQLLILHQNEQSQSFEAWHVLARGQNY